MITLDKKYTYSKASGKPVALLAKPTEECGDYPFYSIDENGALLHHREDGTCPDPDFNLIEAPASPRGITLWMHDNGGIMLNDPFVLGWKGPFKFREILDETPPFFTSSKHSFPPVGSKLRVTKHEFHGTSLTIGDIITVEQHFPEGDGFHAGGFRNFGTNWRDGLEAVESEPPASYPPPESEWQELGPEDYKEIVTKYHQVNATENRKISRGWIAACGITLDVPFGEIADRFHVRRRVTVPQEPPTSKEISDFEEMLNHPHVRGLREELEVIRTEYGKSLDRERELYAKCVAADERADDFRQSYTTLLDSISSETVTEPPIPEGFPPVVIPDGKVGINRGFGWTCYEDGEYLMSCHSWRGWNQCRQAGGRPDGFYIELIDAEPSPLQLRVGGWYENRKGEVVGPLHALNGDDDFKYRDPTGRYLLPNGKYLRGGQSDLDLIREVPAPDPELEAARAEKTIVVQWEKEDAYGYGKAMRVVESSHDRFSVGTRFDFGFFGLATEEGYKIVSLPLIEPSALEAARKGGVL